MLLSYKNRKSASFVEAMSKSACSVCIPAKLSVKHSAKSNDPDDEEKVVYDSDVFFLFKDASKQPPRRIVFLASSPDASSDSCAVSFRSLDGKWSECYNDPTGISMDSIMRQMQSVVKLNANICGSSGSAAHAKSIFILAMEPLQLARRIKKVLQAEGEAYSELCQYLRIGSATSWFKSLTRQNRLSSYSLSHLCRVILKTNRAQGCAEETASLADLLFFSAESARASGIAKENTQSPILSALEHQIVATLSWEMLDNIQA